MKKINYFTLILTTIFITLTGYAQQSPYYVDRRGERQTVEKITADQSGKLRVKLGEGAFTTLRRSDYRYAFVPKPNEVRQLEQLFNRNEYERILNNIEPVLEKYRYLGWGALLHYWQGESQYQQEQFEKAKNSFQKGLQYANNDRHKNFLYMGLTKSFLELGREEEAEEYLLELEDAEEERFTAFYFAINGKLLIERGKTEVGILELFKPILLFEPRPEIEPIRKMARSHLLKILKERGDPRYDRVRKLR